MDKKPLTEELVNDIVLWDINSWSKAVYFWENKIDFSNKQKGLELGSKRGGLSLYLALKGINTICSDYIDCELTAKPLHDKHNVNTFISYEVINALDIPYENHFDVIAFKSILGGIGRNDNLDNIRTTISQIYKALKPGGVLIFAENLAASPIHMFLRKRFTNWSDYWRYVTPNELSQLLGDFSKFELKTTGVIAVFGTNEKLRNYLSYMDDLILNRITNDKYKYISYGYAIK